MTNSQNPLTPTAIRLEALLFVAAEPVLTAQLAAALETTTTEVEQGLRALEESLQTAACACNVTRGACR